MKRNKKLKCLRCEYEWTPIVGNPKICPRCKNHAWNIPRIREKRPTMWDKPKKKVMYVRGKELNTAMKDVGI